MRSGPKSARGGRITARGATLGPLFALLAVIGFLIPAPPASARVPAEFFGIDQELSDSADFPDMRDAGFGSFRAKVDWAVAQPSEDGPYDWTQTDSRVYDAASSGMNPVVNVSGMPGFVHAPAKGLYAPTSTADLGEWEAFNRALAERYGPGGDFYDLHPELAARPVHTWIMWNEQNSKNNWLPKPNPRGYAALLKRGQRGITSFDPGAEIVLGGMYGNPRDSKSMKAADFLKQLYRVPGIRSRFDAVSSHPYGPDIRSVKSQVENLRLVAKKAGDGNVGLWVGELGWASDGPRRSEEVVGRKRQARQLADGLNLLAGKRKAWNVDGVFVYTWQDFPAGMLACSWCAWAGLIDENGDPKPALKAVEKVIERQT